MGRGVFFRSRGSATTAGTAGRSAHSPSAASSTRAPRERKASTVAPPLEVRGIVSTPIQSPKADSEPSPATTPQRAAMPKQTSKAKSNQGQRASEKEAERLQALKVKRLQAKEAKL